MKKLRTIVTVMLLSMILAGMTSCAVRVHEDNGRHKGWFNRHENRHHDEGPTLIIKGDNDHR